MKKIFFLSLTALLIPAFVWAHPGPTDDKGCHFCRKNCDVWGEGVKWHKKHCHGKNEMPVPQDLKRYSMGKEQNPSDQKQPGWEYGMEIKKISAEGPVNISMEK